MKLFNLDIKIDKQNIESLKDRGLAKVKTFFGNKKRNVILIILSSLFVINLILGAISNNIVALMPEMAGAERWSTEHRMAQISLYFTEDQMVEAEGIKRLEYNIEKKLNDAGVTVETYLDIDPEELSSKQQIVETIRIEDLGNEQSQPADNVPTISDLYASCYSAQGIISITFEDRTAENVNAIGVGGDFFIMHPLTLVNGTYFSDDNLMRDGIVIDEDMAWQLFGSSNIVGEMVTIGGIPHYITGVIHKDRGRMRKAAGLNDSYVYLSYDSLARYGDILSGKTSSQEISEEGDTMLAGGINCYEAIMPNPVDGIAAKIVKESAGVDDRYISVIDNTDRFSFFSLIRVIRDFGTRSMWGKPIFYPYWENTARGWEDVLALILFFRLICMGIIVVSITIWIVHLYRHKKWTAGSVLQYILDKKYDFESRRKYYEKENKLF